MISLLLFSYVRGPGFGQTGLGCETTQLHRDAVRIVDVEVSRTIIRLLDRRGIEVQLRGQRVHRLELICGKTEEHTLALEGLTSGNVDELELEIGRASCRERV